MMSRRAARDSRAKVLASRAASLASSALAVTARMLLSPSGVTVIASSTFLAVQSPPSSRRSGPRPPVDLISVAAVCDVRVGSPASRTALRPWNCVSSCASGVRRMFAVAW